MADDGKRTEMVCTKLTERVSIDLMRAAAIDDRSVSDFLFMVIRHELYGRSVKWPGADDDLQGQTR